MIETKFIFTLLLSLFFLAFHFLILRKEKGFKDSTIVQGVVTEAFFLDEKSSKYGFSIDRGEAFGHFIKIRYQHNGEEKEFDSTHSLEKITEGSIVELEVSKNNHVKIKGESQGKFIFVYLAAFAVLFILGSIGVVMNLLGIQTPSAL